ncbi:MAG: PDZ domain-containing protein, partial [Clostridiales bacterium]|nr:PDZ domain-containing protein [Clostridiales bacterium]
MVAEIAAVYPDSIAERLGLKPGDQILAVNGKPPADLIQFQWEWAGEEVSLTVQTESGIEQHTIRKAYDENPGVSFLSPVFDGIRTCANHCVFCFVDQMPAGCRDSLYIKDDDYRLSFLQGSYITMTNLSVSDLLRIENERLSPLYISVHATDPGVRSAMLGRHEDHLWEIMSRLGGEGIEFHCQIVLCPGYNDGEVFFRTVEDLGNQDGVASVAVVPVGLTGFREGLAPLRPLSREEARALIT